MGLGVRDRGGHEILQVLALAAAGLLLAVVAAFLPWYGESSGRPDTAVVDVQSP